MLYKYPQAAFPYSQLVEENRRRGADQTEFELLDTGLFDDDRYFDVFVEYAKGAPDDVLMQITAHNRGPDSAPLIVAAATVLPQYLVVEAGRSEADAGRPLRRRRNPTRGPRAHSGWISIRHRRCCSATTRPIPAGCSARHEASGYFKDAFHEYVVHGKHDAVNPGQTGTKVGALYEMNVPPGGAVMVRLRLSPDKGATAKHRPFADFDAIFATRRAKPTSFMPSCNSGSSTPTQSSCNARRLPG